MKIDIQRLEAPIKALESRWAAVPQLLRKIAMPAGFIGLLGVTGLIMLKLARGYLFDKWGTVAFIVSLVLLLGGIALNLPGFLRGVLEYFSPRRTLYGMNVLIVIVLAFAALVFVNYLANRHYLRWDLSADKLYSLDGRTLTLLGTIDQATAEKGDLDIYFLYIPGVHPRTGFNLARRMNDLLKEYDASSRHVHVHTYNYASTGDQQRLLGALNEQEIEKSAIIPPWVLINYNGQQKELKGADLLEVAPPMGRQQPPPPKFKGEDALSSTIRDLLNPQKVVCYFLTGHGERGLSPARGNMNWLQENLRGLNMEVKTLNLPKERTIPTDANVIIIPDPGTPPLLPEEIEKLKIFVKNMRGHVIVLAEPRRTKSGIEKFLLNYGIKLRSDIKTFQQVALPGRMDYMEIVVASEFRTHPVLEAIVSAGKNIFMHGSCAIETVTAKDSTYEAKFLFKGGTVGKTYLDSLESGPFILAAVSEPRNPEAKAGKVAAFADCDFIGDVVNIEERLRQGPSIDLVLNTISFFAKRQENMGIEERKPIERFITFTPTSKNILYYGIIIVLPIVVILAGIFVLLIRRK